MGHSYSIGVRGVCLTLSPESCPVFEITTGVFISTANSHSLADFFCADFVDPTVAVCLDAPGMGKTTAPECAAAACGSIYVRFSATGVVTSALHRLRALLNQAAATQRVISGDGQLDKQHGGTFLPCVRRDRGTLSGKAAERIGVAVWKLALVACMNRCRDGLVSSKKRIQGLCARNGADFLVADADVQTTFDAAREALLAVIEEGARAQSATGWASGANVAMHFDEIQAMLPAPTERSRVNGRYPPGYALPEECMKYCLVWFSTALREMCVGGRIRPCISGISVDVVASVRLDPGLKLWPLEPLPCFGVGFAKEVLTRYLRFEDDADLQLVARGAAGCPRAVQHVLLVAKVRAAALLHDGIVLPSISCSELVHLAYNSWRHAGVGVFLRGQKDHLPAAEEAFLCACFPLAWDATACTEESVPVVNIAVAKMPQTWRDAAHVGVLRLRISNDVATLFLPYPFLERYIRGLGQQRLDTVDCIDLVQRARSLPAARGSTGRAKVFEFGVALELCLPGPPLLRAILECDQLRSFKLRPRSRRVLSLRAFAVTSDIGASCDEVLIVSDSISTGDTMIPVVLGNGSDAWLVLETKFPTQESPRFVRAVLVKCIDKMERASAAFPLSFYLSTMDASATISNAVTAERALTEFNATSSDRPLRRSIGLVVLDDELLSICSPGLARVLRCDEAEYARLSDAAWYRFIFEDSEARVRDRIADSLMARAADAFASVLPGDRSAAVRSHNSGLSVPGSSDAAVLRLEKIALREAATAEATAAKAAATAVADRIAALEAELRLAFSRKL